VRSHHIPGTHNSAFSQAYLNGQTTAREDTINYVISQSKLIPAQLDDGVRLLDLSLTARKPSTGWSGADDHLWVAQTVSAFGTNNLTYYAQDARGNAISFKRAVNYARAFLRKHPSETVIVYLRADGTDVQNVFSQLRQEIDEYASYLYLENDMPRLKDVRGKVVICSDHSELLGARGGMFVLIGKMSRRGSTAE
jgi:hypothetical protein